MRRILSVGLLALACGNTSESQQTTTSSGGGGGSAGSAMAGAPSSGGSAGRGSGDFIDDFLDASGALCREIRRCYPELQTDPTQCTGPADDVDNMVVWIDPTAALTDTQLAEIAVCLRRAENQDAFRVWSECVVAAQQEDVACVTPCPESVQACAEAGNASDDMCDALQPANAEEIQACFAAVLG